MQALGPRNTYTPTNASLVCGNCGLPLNREETLSVASSKTGSNNSEVNQLPIQKEKERRDLRVPVYVLNMRGRPLMPTTPRKARFLLRTEKARVAQRSPFTIQLNYSTGETKQPIRLGLDPGYSHMGFSAITAKIELISGEITIRKDISKKLVERRQYRRNRRNKLRYRKPRFSNRKRTESLSPSIRHKLQTNINLVQKIKKILPVTSITVEVSSFDTQKMQNPEISGIEYQQGELQGYEIREYLLEKYDRTCAYCGKSNIPLQVEHIVPKSRGGSDRVSNLTISCFECNRRKGNRTAEEFGHPEVQEQAKQSLKSAAFMNTIKWQLVRSLNCSYTYGHITKYNRTSLNLEKTHTNDAFVIAGGTDQKRTRLYLGRQTRRNNRAIQTNRNGFKPSIRKGRYSLQPNDLVFIKLKSVTGIVKGVFNYGKWIRVVDSIGNIINTNINNVELIKYAKGLQLQFI